MHQQNAYLNNNYQIQYQYNLMAQGMQRQMMEQMNLPMYYRLQAIAQEQYQAQVHARKIQEYQTMQLWKQYNQEMMRQAFTANIYNGSFKPLDQQWNNHIPINETNENQMGCNGPIANRSHDDEIEQAKIDSTKTSDQVDLKKDSKLIFSIAKKTKCRQLTGQKRKRDDEEIMPTQTDTPAKQIRKPRGKKTMKERANELLQDSFLMFDKEPAILKAEPEEEEEEVQEAKEEEEEEEEKDNEINSVETIPKVLYYPNNYESTKSMKDFMKYNFNFDKETDYTTERLITNFNSQHALIEKDSFGLIKTSRNLKTLNDAEKLPKKTWSYEEYLRKGNDENLKNVIERIEKKWPKRTLEFEEDFLLTIIQLCDYDIKISDKYITSTEFAQKLKHLSRKHY